MLRKEAVPKRINFNAGLSGAPQEIGSGSPRLSLALAGATEYAPMNIEPNAALACSKGFVGHHCRLQGTLAVRRCSADQVVREVPVDDDALGGTDPRSDAGARARALQALRTPAAQAALLEELNDVLPL